MKKKFKLLSTALLALTIVGCSCDNSINSLLNEPANIVTGDKLSQKFTTQDVYDYIKNNSPETYNKAFIKVLVQTILEKKSSYKKEELKETYEYKLLKFFQDNFINNQEYHVDGEFDEKLLVAHLRRNLYKIGDPKQGVELDSVINKELHLKYDYSKYIEEAVDYDICMELLREDYIANNRTNILDNSKSRIITVYSADDFEDMEVIAKDLFDKKYSSFAKLEETKKDEAKKELGRQYCENLGLENPEYRDESGKIIENCTPSKSSYDTSYSKFTTCENGTKCDLKSGFDYQIEQVDKNVYLEEQVINADSTDILFENALLQLKRSDVANYLLSDAKMADIFSDGYEEYGKFLINNKANFANLDSKSIIFSEGPGKKCYIVLVKVVDSKTKNIVDKQKVLALLKDKVNETSVLMHYVESIDVDLYDSKLVEAYKGIID